MHLADFHDDLALGAHACLVSAVCVCLVFACAPCDTAHRRKQSAIRKKNDTSSHKNLVSQGQGHTNVVEGNCFMGIQAELYRVYPYMQNP